MFQSLLKIPQNLGGLLRSKQFPLVTPSHFKGSSTNQNIIDGIAGNDIAGNEQNGNADETFTQIFLKNYDGDNETIKFVKMNPKVIIKEFILKEQRKNYREGDTVYSTELNGLRGIISGKYPYLALYQYQLPDSPLKELVSELSNANFDRIYRYLRAVHMIDSTGKLALQQLYRFQLGHYISQTNSLPDFHLKMPECFELTNTQHCKKLFDLFMESYEETIPMDYQDLLLKEKPVNKVIVGSHKDDIFAEKILNYVVQSYGK
ncbi:uncharacterized protein LOC116342492 [Contarinia nasturtii]|uniref:uncharacterized protein LOC116342492 n=1 Tax=Contarinia nasturtii TaxID=265458 RepID=UPI0012D3E5DF|nr:uncharacterized protein LOC116342492 [Contarinia nasturtii]